jgi:hypothetical protein
MAATQARKPDGAAIAQTLQVSDRIWRHAVFGLPDQTLKAPPIANRAEYGIVEDDDRAVPAVPSTINTGTPVFKQAAPACGFHSLRARPGFPTWG